jgi:hypothetical protein
VQCQLGSLNVYLITGGSNVSTIFRPSFTADPFILRVLEHTAGYARTDLDKFSKDKSGNGKISRPGTDVAPEERIWFLMHRMNSEALVSLDAATGLSTSLQSFFNQELSHFPTGEWAEVRIFDFLRHHMAYSAICAAVGPRIFEVNPDLIDALWDYERFAETLMYGLPKWLNADAIQARDRFSAMCRKWYELAEKEFDWEENEKTMRDVEYEPVLGSRYSRGLACWARSFGFSKRSMGGLYATFFFGLVLIPGSVVILLIITC